MRKQLTSLIILCLFTFSCKKENNTRIKEIEILRYERARIDTILPVFYTYVNSSGKALAVANLQKNKLDYCIFRMNQIPSDESFKYDDGKWIEDLPSIQGSRYCLKVIYKDNSSKTIYIDDNKMYSNSCLLKFVKDARPDFKINRKFPSDTLIVNSKMKLFISFVVHNDSSIMRSPQIPKLH
jgi:hypothetical protein